MSDENKDQKPQSDLNSPDPEQIKSVEPERKFAVPEPGESHLRHIVESSVVPEIGDDDEEALVRPEEPTMATPEAAVDNQTRAPRHDRFEKWFVLLLAVFGTLTVLASSFNVGMAWDEAYYVDAAKRTYEWSAGVIKGEKTLLTNRMLFHYWDAFTLEPKGHPPMTRWLGALGMFLGGWETGQSPLPFMRWPFAVCFGLTLSFLYLLMRMAYGRVTAWITVVAYFFMPRVFGHAHFALTETPMNMFAILLVYSFLRGIKNWRWAVITGILFGFTLATKINALFFIPILWGWAFLFKRRDAAPNLYAMTFIGPAILLAIWPWLWYETAENIVKFLAWNVQRGQPLMFFNERVFGPDNPVPASYAPKMLCLTVPIITLLLAALGLARAFHSPKQQSHGLLFLIAFLFPLAVMMAPSTPVYDGVRLFLPVFPFLAALAGIGGAVIVRACAWFDHPGRKIRLGACAVATLIVLIAFSGSWGMLAVNPHFLTYFNVLSGKRLRAYQTQEMTYWGECINKPALERISDNVPAGATLSARAMNIETLRYAQKWGWLADGIQIIDHPFPQYLLIQHRKGWLVPIHPVDKAVKENTAAWGYERIAVFPESAAGKSHTVVLASLWKRTEDFDPKKISH